MHLKCNYAQIDHKHRIINVLARCNPVKLRRLGAILCPFQEHWEKAAARFQSDLLLVYRVKKGSYEKYRYVKPDQAKAFCDVEALLLDVRTGVVPFTTRASEEFQVQKTADDFSFVETVNKAEGEALGKALVSVAIALSTFLDRVP